MENLTFIAGGDSFIFGNELKDWSHNSLESSKYTCSYLLYQYFKFQFYSCVARPGNSNDAIMRTVISKCEQVRQENKKIFVMAMWTFPPRFEFPFSFKIDSPDNPFASISIYPDTNRPMVQDFARYFIKNIDVQWYQHYKTIQSILLLQNYLKFNNIPYCFTISDNIVFSYQNNEQLLPYWKMIDWDPWFMFAEATEPYNTTAPRGFYQWALENKYPIGPQQHPLEKAHEDAAFLMKDKIYELVKKNI